MKKTPKAVTSHGMITDVMLPVQPNSDIRMNMGTTPTWMRTAMVAITKTRRRPRPRKRSLAKAQPAKVQKNTTEQAVAVDTIRRLPMAFQKGIVVIARSALDQK